MTRFTWKYGTEQLLFHEDFNERDYWEDDFESENEIKQPSEYLFDIHLSKLMKRAVLENEYDIKNKEMHLGYDVVQNFLAYNKGLLADIDKTTYSESNDVDLRNDVFQFIDYCRLAWRGGEPLDVAREEFPNLFDENSPYQNEATAIETYFSYENHRGQPYYLYEKLVQKISPLMRERRQLVRMIKYILPYTYQFQSLGGNVLTCQMILDDSYYLDFMDEARELISADTTETINQYLASTSNDEAGFQNAVNHMIACINSCDRGGNHNFGRFRGKKSGCFSIFDINTDEYVSLSGPFDITDATIETYFNFSHDKKRSNREFVNRINNIILTDPILQSSTYANLNLQTRRYPYTNGPSIPFGGESVKDAINRKVDSNEIQGDFSCCERKIFSFIPNTESGQCYMFTRHEPCSKCRPAIREFLQIPGRQMRIFYYDNDAVKEFDMNTL